jgi:hypothetical protein
MLSKYHHLVQFSNTTARYHQLYFWDQREDIRDVISIGKLLRKNDGPEEVEQILGTMIKFGEKNEH